MPFETGTLFAGYQIERLIGRGGMGEVYLARHRVLGRLVALKLLAPNLAADETFRERFLSESRIAASLDHPNVVTVYEAGEADRQLYLAMRYVDGEDLERVIGREGPLDPARAIRLLAGVAAALDAAHKRGLVHRDVKPGNVLVAHPGTPDEHAYLADFGLVKQLGGANLTAAGQFVGSAAHVAPEQVEGHAVDALADVYSLAAVVFHALAGQPPFQRATDLATLWAHVHAAPPLLSDVRPALASMDAILQRGMAKAPAERQVTAGVLLAALSAAVHGSDPAVVPIAADRTVRGNEPVSLEPIIGRDSLLEELHALTEHRRLITLTGPGGSGKTRTLLALLDRARASREAVFCDLTTLRNGEDLAATLATMLRLPDADTPEMALRTWAQAGSRLLGLDNLEQAPGIDRPITALLGAAPELRIIATSRGPIGAASEYEVRIPGLTQPAADDPESVEASAAGALFLDRARALGSLRAALDPKTAADIAQLCRVLDGLPLGIELAAARTRILSPGAILERIRRLDTGVLSRSIGPERHRSLGAVLDWSIGLLSELERRVLQACAACTGTFSLPLVESMVGDGDALTAMDTLVAHGLVAVRDEVAGEPRFVLLESVRLTVLASADLDLDDLRARHAAAVADLVRTWGPHLDGPRSREALGRLELDRSNLEAAIEWSSAHDPHLAVALLWGSAGFWAIRGWADRSIAALRSVLAAGDLAPAERARALAALVRVLYRFGTEAEWEPLARQAAELGRELGDAAVELEGLITLVSVGEESGVRPDVGDVIRRILAIQPTTDRERTLVFHAQMLLAAEGEDVAAERAFLEQAMPDVRAGGNPQQLAISLSNLAYAQMRLGEPGKALGTAEESLAIARELGQAGLEVHCLTIIALCRTETGDPAGALDAIGRAIRISVALGTPFQVMDVIRARGTVAAILGQPLDAAWYLGAAEAAFAPAALADPTDDLSSGAGRHWEAAKRSLDPGAWEQAQREGREAGLETALARAVAPLAATAAETRPTPLRRGLLTAREIEILSFVAAGASDRAIAEKLYISTRTVSVHVANAKAKLGVASRLGLALRAREVLGVGVETAGVAVSSSSDASSWLGGELITH